MTGETVLIHGFTGSPESWHEVTSRLGPARILTPALLGHDGTPGTEGGSDFEGEVDRLAEVIGHWSTAPAHLVGYSLGGRVALGLAVRHPSRFRTVTLIGVHPGLDDPAEREARALQDEEWARLLEQEGVGTFVAAWEALPIFAAQERAPAVALERQRRIRMSHDPQGLARSLRVLGLAAMPDYRPALRRIPVPVRVVVGGGDAKFRALAEEMVERLRRGELRVVDGAGHNVVLERPTEIVRLLKELEET